MTKKLSLLLSVLILSFGFGYFIFAWTEPGSTPPDGNVPAPINVGGTGQVKSGKVGVATDGIDASYGLTVGNSSNLLGIKTSGNSYFGKNLTLGGNLTVSGRHLYLGSQDIYGDNSSALYWDSNHDTATQMIFRDRQNTIYGRVYGSGDGANFGLLSADGSWAVRATNSGTQIYHGLTIDGNATVSGQNVCRQDGTYCPAFSTDCASCDSRFINVGESGDSIADNTIDSSEIQDNTLTASDLAPNSCGNSELIDSPTFTTLYVGSYGDIYSDSSWLRLNQNHTQNIYTPRIIRADGGFQVDGTTVIGGDAWVEGDRIRQNTIDGSEIQDNTLTASDLAANSVGNSELNNSQSFTVGGLTMNGNINLNGRWIENGYMRRSNCYRVTVAWVGGGEALVECNNGYYLAGVCGGNNSGHWGCIKCCKL